MLLLLISIIHIKQASKSSANTRNLYIGLRQKRIYQYHNWNAVQLYYQKLEYQYFKRLLYLSVVLTLIDIMLLITYRNAWLVLIELCIYFTTLFVLSKKVENYIKNSSS